MHTNAETIDILIPVYNGEKYIKKCLDSLLNQTYKNLRIVLVNDGSTDKSEFIINEYISSHPQIELFNKQNEKSISKTRNFLLEKIQSKYFTFFDIDDYAEPTYIECLYNLITCYNADMSLCAKSRHNENKKPNLEKENKNVNSIIFMNQQECLCEMISSKLFNGTVYAKLMKAETLKNCKFDPNIHYGEDLDFCFKIMKNCKSFVYTPKKLYHYLIRNNSIVTSTFKPTKLTLLDCYENLSIETLSNPELNTCVNSMKGLISIELLYYIWRDKYKDKDVKKKLKQAIKSSIPFIKKNKRLTTLYKFTPYIWWLTKIM